MKNKLPAFTIIELIAVMLISGLIFSMMLLVVQIMQQQNMHQEEQHQEVLQIEQLETLLQKDAYEAKAILIESKQLFFDYEDYHIAYTFNEQQIWRSIIETVVHTDTFFLPTLRLECAWQGQIIEKGRTDKILLQTNFFEQVFDITIQKNYDYKTLLEQEQYVARTAF